jgi:hypothetical protein
VTTNDDRAAYLATGEGEIPNPDRLDMVREILSSASLWAEPPASAVDGIGAGVSADVRVPDTHRRIDWRLPLMAGAAAIAILVVGLLGVLNRSAPEPDALVSLAGTELMPAASGTAAVRGTSSGWAIRLEIEGLPPAPVGSFYQGWVWSEEGEGVSIGTFHLRGGNYPVTLWAGVELVDYPWIWVTLQDEGAGPGASSRVMMLGAIEGLDE